MWRILAILGGVGGAVALSQFPEFSQQYLQRLAGKVDALTAIAVQFDATATKNDLTREAALAAMTGSPVLIDQQADMRATLALQARLADNLATLRAATPLARLTMPQRLGDVETLQATYVDFKPAVPASTEGTITAGIGYAGGWSVVRLLGGLLSWPFARRRRYLG
ncbi:MAG: DUF2937 family protein [Pseudorhodobacter sp.]|nr:DUF2937 family protein [Pseudorhodobacter sp.]